MTPGVSSAGPTLPVLFGRGSLMAQSGGSGQLSVASGITVRATAIAAAGRPKLPDGTSYQLAGPRQRGHRPTPTQTLAIQSASLGHAIRIEQTTWQIGQTISSADGAGSVTGSWYIVQPAARRNRPADRRERFDRTTQVRSRVRSPTPCYCPPNLDQYVPEPIGNDHRIRLLPQFGCDLVAISLTLTHAAARPTWQPERVGNDRLAAAAGLARHEHYSACFRTIAVRQSVYAPVLRKTITLAQPDSSPHASQSAVRSTPQSW